METICLINVKLINGLGKAIEVEIICLIYVKLINEENVHYHKLILVIKDCQYY